MNACGSSAENLRTMETPSGEVKRVQEQIWVLRAQNGDKESFEMLVDAYDRRLLYFVRRFEHDVDKAMDLVQEVWLTVYRKIGKLNSPDRFRTWLYRIAHAKVATRIRRDMRETKANLSTRTKTAESADGRQSEKRIGNAELVHLALERISPQHREVLALRFLEDMQLKEIAEILKCSIGTIKSRMHYAKQSFRQVIEELEDD
jgi:RNA polymerase sigma-70 factor (ECF subfamily)